MPIFQWWRRRGNPTSPSAWDARDADVTLGRPPTHSMSTVPGPAVGSAHGKQTGDCGPPQTPRLSRRPGPKINNRDSRAKDSPIPPAPASSKFASAFSSARSFLLRDRGFATTSGSSDHAEQSFVPLRVHQTKSKYRTTKRLYNTARNSWRVNLHDLIF